MEKQNAIDGLEISNLPVYTLPYNIESSSNIVWDTIGKPTDKELEDAIQKQGDDTFSDKKFKELLLAEQKNRQTVLEIFNYELMPIISKNPVKLESFSQLEDLVKSNKIRVETLKVYIKTLLTNIPCSLFCIIKKLEKENQ